MREILKSIIEGMVTDKVAVSVAETIEDGTVMLKVEVAEPDMGKIIGKEGRIAQAIRIVMKCIAAEEGKRINIEFIG
ncbi:MAG: KH domain-containing protein [Firmicutes bacterium]|nr:KH domain-containing protein [Bacillota bacterium]